MTVAILPVFLALLTVFSALARGAHDLWAATLVYWAVLAALAIVIARASLREEPLTRDLAPSLIAAAVALAASAALAGDKADAVFALSDWLAAAGVFWLALQAFRSEKAVRVFCAIVAPLFWIELAVIVWQRYAAHYLVPIPKTVLYPGVSEIWILLSYSVPGTLVNSNAAAAFHLLWLPVLTRRALEERKPFWTASASCCLLGIVLLNSTSAMLCALAAAPFLAGPKAMAWARRRPRLVSAALAAAGSAAVFLILHKVMRTDDGTGTAIPLSSKISRLGWWLTGLAMFRDHPWFGVGPGNFPDAFLAYKTGKIPNTLFAHSFPVTFLAEAGLAGLAGMAVFLGSLGARLRRLRGAAESPFLLGAAMLLAYTTINIGLEYLANLMALALFLGAAAAPAVPARWRPSRLGAALAGSIALAVAAYAAAPLQASRLVVAGDELLAAGDAAGARKRYESALKLYPLSSEARARLARTTGILPWK